MLKLAFNSKILLSFAFLALFLITIVYFLPLHSKNSMMGGSPCLFEVVTRTDCTKEIGDSRLANHHLTSLQETFTATPTDTTLLLTITILAFGLVAFLRWERNHIELYTQTILKQKWKEHQFLEKIFDPIKKALRTGILERKEPSLVIA
jgi:hypothetical protein